MRPAQCVSMGPVGAIYMKSVSSRADPFTWKTARGMNKMRENTHDNNNNGERETMVRDVVYDGANWEFDSVTSYDIFANAL